MSWSTNACGTPEGVAQSIEKSCQSYQPPPGSAPSQSAKEFAAAAPHLAALVRQVCEKREGQPQPIVKMSASGSGLEKNGEPIHGTISVNIETIWPYC